MNILWLQHQLELELERMQEKLQDLELELDRSHQRELEARHDIERYKLYPSVSPRMAFSDCQVKDEACFIGYRKLSLTTN